MIAGSVRQKTFEALLHPDFRIMIPDQIRCDVLRRAVYYDNIEIPECLPP
jgi:hypothetical protein